MEKAGELPAQQRIDSDLRGDGLTALYRADVGAYNDLYPRFNANIDFARERCIAKPGAAAPAK